jgi:metallo-beta-lactamase family protein
MSTLQFLGATQTVTGSKFVLEADGTRVMIDCGLFQGLKDLRLRNWEPFPIPTDELDAVVLTHAHIDHTGYLPKLVKQGYWHPVYGTPATVDLCRLLLPDSAKLQEEDARHANRQGYTKHAPALPLYTVRDARAALKLMKSIPYSQPVKLSKSLTFRFIPAGHILGSSFVEFEVGKGSHERRRVVFSGDIGRYEEPILPDPTPIDQADYLIIESTYGNRLHSNEDPKQRLEEVIGATVERGGQVLIPAFAVGRTQQVLYLINELEREGRIPILPVRVDSPMAIDASEKYVRHHEDHDLEMQDLLNHHRNPLVTRNFQMCRSMKASQELLRDDQPMIIISASGMATGGRILHHLKTKLPDERNTIVFVGFQAEGTRGRRILEREPTIKIHGEVVPVRARIEQINSLSAHADYSEILRWLKELQSPPRRVFIVHGEPSASQSLAEKITEPFGWPVSIPSYLQKVDLD